LLTVPCVLVRGACSVQTCARTRPRPTCRGRCMVLHKHMTLHTGPHTRNSLHLSGAVPASTGVCCGYAMCCCPSVSTSYLLVSHPPPIGRSAPLPPLLVCPSLHQRAPAAVPQAFPTMWLHCPPFLTPRIHCFIHGPPCPPFCSRTACIALSTGYIVHPSAHAPPALLCSLTTLSALLLTHRLHCFIHQLHCPPFCSRTGYTAHWLRCLPICLRRWNTRECQVQARSGPGAALYRHFPTLGVDQVRHCTGISSP